MPPLSPPGHQYPPDQQYPPWDTGEADLSVSLLPDDAPPAIREEAERRDRYIILCHNYRSYQSSFDMFQHYKDARAMLRDVNGITSDLTTRQAKWQILLRILLASIHIHLNHPWRAFRNTLGAYQAIEELAEQGVLFEQGIWLWMRDTTLHFYLKLYPHAMEKRIPDRSRGRSPVESTESELVSSDSEDSEEDSDEEEGSPEGDEDTQDPVAAQSNASEVSHTPENPMSTTTSSDDVQSA